MNDPAPLSLKLPSHIRAARQQDARDLAYLINEAAEGLPKYLWSQDPAVKAGRMHAWELGAMRAARDEGDFSWRNAWVTESGGEVVAMLLGFVIPPQDLEPGDLAELPDIVQPIVKLEQQVADSWYINAIAVKPEFRGSGIGGELLKLAHALALRAGCKEVSLQNFASNARARRLYQALGFREKVREPMPRVPGLPDFGESILHVMPVNRDYVTGFLA